MPKKRFEEHPYDPISADLVRDATAGALPLAVARSGIAIVPPRSQLIAPPELTITKRFVLSRSEDAEMNGFLLRLQQAARTKVPLGVIVRAALSVVIEAEAGLCTAVGRRTFRLPSTHDRLALGEFEDQWRECLQVALTGR